MRIPTHVHWIAAPVVILLACSAVVIYAIVIRARADAILRDVAALSVGVSSTRQLESVAARHRQSVVENSCTGTTCVVSFQVYNTWLYRLKLEPVARFFASVQVKDGVVKCIDVLLMRDTNVFPTSPSAGQTIECVTTPKFLEPMASPPYWFPTPVGKPYLLTALTAHADPVQRQHAYAFSFRCLVKSGGGCDLPCDYLPLAWHDWQRQLEQQGFAPNGFGDYYPTRARCP